MCDFLTAGGLAAYKDFAIYFLGLGLPIILLSLAGITGYHYWNKRKKIKLGIPGEVRFESAELPPESSPLPPLTAIERHHVIKQIRKQLSGYRARNVALRHDYLYYQKRRMPYTNDSSENTSYMENFAEKITAYEKQIAEMQNKIDMLETMPPPLNNEAHYLREMLAEKDKQIQNLRNINDISDLHDEGKATSSNNSDSENELKEENHRLKSLIHEQEHINDLLYESREQVNFLQNQLEQRIKTAKLLEQRVTMISGELTQAQSDFHEAGKKILKMGEVLEEKDKEMGQLRLQIDTRDNEIQHLKTEIHSKNEQMLAFERSMNEMMQENELNKSAIGNDRDVISSLNNKLIALNEENEHLKNQLRQNKDVLYRFYKEIKSSVQEEEFEEHAMEAH